MFEPGTGPRVFGLAPGVDFPRALLDGLLARLKGQPPEALARVDLIVNTARMERRLRLLFDEGPARLLPRLHLVTRLDRIAPGIALPPAIHPLRRRLELLALGTRLGRATRAQLGSDIRTRGKTSRKAFGHWAMMRE